MDERKKTSRERKIAVEATLTFPFYFLLIKYISAPRSLLRSADFSSTPPSAPNHFSDGTAESLGNRVTVPFTYIIIIHCPSPIIHLNILYSGKNRCTVRDCIIKERANTKNIGSLQEILILIKYIKWENS